jgi:hypothetical protein
LFVHPVRYDQFTNRLIPISWHVYCYYYLRLLLQEIVTQSHPSSSLFSI